MVGGLLRGISRLLRRLPAACRAAVCLAVAVSLTGCMKYGPPEEEKFDFGSGEESRGVFVVHEGNFTADNATLSYYAPATGRVENEVFARANAVRLGDTAQSMAIRGEEAFVVVNNSGVIYIIDKDTFLVRGLITGFVSPRYIHFVSETKAYVTAIDDPRISIVNPLTRKITGHISTPGHYSTEQMVQYGKYVFVTCWSRDNTVLVIDSEVDAVVEEITTRVQPRSMVIDKNGKVWVLTDGGYGDDGHGQHVPALCRIDAATREVEQEFLLSLGDTPRELNINGAGDTLYFINGGVWKMDVNAEKLPAEPFIGDRGTIYYALGVDPTTSEVYVGDAIDYRQRGVIYRFSPDGESVDTFRTAIIPSSFCFK